MEPEITRKHGTTIVTLPRRFDIDSAPGVEQVLRPVIAEHPKRILFDFSKTEYVSSAGMRVILAASKALQEHGGTVALCSPARETRYVLEITGFTKIFTIYPDLEEAFAGEGKDR